MKQNIIYVLNIHSQGKHKIPALNYISQKNQENIINLYCIIYVS